MTRQEELRERYEEALFALLMDEVARSEGEALLRQTETAPQPRREAERNDLGTIRRTVRQKQTRQVGRASLRVLGKAAMVAGLAASLFLGAFALSEDVRAGTMNMMIEISETGTTFQFLAPKIPEEEYLPLLVPQWLPEGFLELSSSAFTSKSWVRYGISEEEYNEKYIEFNYMKTAGTVMSIDTEDAKMETIQLNGQNATLVQKGNEENEIHVVYVTEDQQYLVRIYSIRVPLEDVLRAAENLT